MTTQHHSPILSTGSALATLVLMLVLQPAHATWFLNGIGLGAVRLDVQCAGPAITATALSPILFNASVSIPGTIPLPATCNPASFGSSSNGLFWSHASNLLPALGDGFLDASTDLLPFITPVSQHPQMTVSASGVQVNSSTVSFTVNFLGSDTGTAIRVRAFEYLEPLTPGVPPGFNGDVTSLPNWSTESMLLDNSGILVGDGTSHILNFTVIDPAGNANNIILTGDDVAESVPEPGSLALFSLGGISLLGYGWHRRKQLKFGSR